MTNREHYEAQRRDIANRPSRPDRPACHCEIPLAMPGTPDICGYCAGGLGPEPSQNRMPDPNPGIEDPTAPPPGVQRLPSVVTSMTPDTFKQWLDSDGELFVVYLPGQRSFIIKVPAVHNAFFVSMMQQVKFTLGPEVQAIRMTVVSGPPPDFDERGDPIPPADGRAERAPGWAQPAEHVYEPEPTECPEMDGCTIHDADGNTKP